MIFKLDVINILIGIVATINIAYGLIVFSRNRQDATNFFFFLLTLTVTFWGISIFCYRAFDDLLLKVLFSKILYISAITIPFSFLFFVFKFTGTRIKKGWTILLFIPLITMILLTMAPTGLIRGVQIIPGAENVILFNKSLHILYGFYIIAYFCGGYFLLFKKLFKAEGLFRIQIIYTIIGTLVSTTIGVTTNLTLPLFGIFSLNWMGQIGVVVMIISISYAILKYNLFNIRLIATETFVAALWIFIFIRIFISENRNEQITNSVLLSLTIVIGIFLIKSVRKEVEQREKIEELSNQKSEFMSFATHELRNPLTSVKGITSEILEGDFGEISAVLRNAVNQVFIRSNDVVQLIQQYLDKSKFELGQISYQMDKLDIKETTAKLADDFKHHLEQRKVLMDFSADGGPHIVMGDRGKIQEVVGNLIDNAIKYSPENAHVIVSVTREDKLVKVRIKDNGIGISKDVQEKLFQKFSRATDARKVNIKGSGLGLYLAKQFMEGHKGRIWVESEGEGKGSTFAIELPAVEA